jgi:Protein of unknown function (DUF2934)
MVERQEVLRDGIARRAYEIYVQRGEENGRDVEDWLRAEKEISGKPADVPAKSNGRSRLVPRQLDSM